MEIFVTKYSLSVHIVAYRWRNLSEKLYQVILFNVKTIYSLFGYYLLLATSAQTENERFKFTIANK